jgi:hypothetical protein
VWQAHNTARQHLQPGLRAAQGMPPMASVVAVIPSGQAYLHPTRCTSAERRPSEWAAAAGCNAA